MTKPSLEDFNLTKEEYLIEKRKDEKIATFVLYCVGMIIISVNLYLISSGDYSFSFTDIFELLLMNMIGITIVLTGVFGSVIVLILIYIALQRTILPNLNIKLSLVKHDPRYIKYKEAVGEYGTDIEASYRFEELMQDEMTPKEANYYKIIREYAKTIVRTMEQRASLYPALRFPESLLPYKKEDIRKAINYAIQNTTDKKDKSELEGLRANLIFFIEDEKANVENIKRRNIRERRKRMLGRKS